MFNLKNIFIQLIYFIIELCLFLFVFSSLNYFNIISITFFKFIKLFILMLLLFYNSIVLGKKNYSKKFISCVCFSSIINLFFLFFTIFNSKFQFKLLLFYLIVFLVSLLGCYASKRKKED